MKEAVKGERKSAGQGPWSGGAEVSRGDRRVLLTGEGRKEELPGQRQRQRRGGMRDCKMLPAETKKKNVCDAGHLGRGKRAVATDILMGPLSVFCKSAGRNLGSPLTVRNHCTFGKGPSRILNGPHIGW